MNLPHTIDRPPSSSERTGEYPGPGASPPPTRRAFRIAFGSAHSYPSDVRQILQKRLRFIGLVITILYGLFTVLNLVTALQRLDEFLASWWYDALNILVFFLGGAVTVVLWARRVLPVNRLRILEATLFLLVVIDCGYGLAFQLFANGFLTVPAGKGDSFLFYAASGQSIFFFALVVSYSTFIPCTWQRCAVMVGVMVLTPLAISLGACLTQQPVARNLLWFFLPMAMWLSAAVGIAVYGTHRVEAMRRDLSEARKLGQYLLKQRLGVGGMGEVYLAEHVLLRRPCAVKLIAPERAGEPRNLLRFEREVQTTATLTHPNTVQIFDYGHAADGTFYYAMEYLPGLTLEQLVETDGPLPPARAVHFLRQVCGALREAHAIGFIHRDIKPSNIMACERGGLHDVAKLLDFGLVLAPAARERDERLTQEGVVAGTPAYMSPEQAAGQENVGASSDVYSLGAVAYYLLTGQPPFAGRSPVQMLAAHIYESPAPLTSHRADVPTELQTVVLRCLSKEPAERYPDALALETVLVGCPGVDLWKEEEAANWWRSQFGLNGSPE
jgi:serine/threonine-protein kinase